MTDPLEAEVLRALGTFDHAPTITELRYHLHERLGIPLEAARNAILDLIRSGRIRVDNLRLYR